MCFWEVSSDFLKGKGFNDLILYEEPCNVKEGDKAGGRGSPVHN
jgi:hypothetical protein